MASPWKFLARLVSPRRRPEQDASAIGDLKPEVLAIGGQTGTPVKEGLHIADQSAGEQPQPVDRSDGLPAEPEQSGETSRGALDNVERESATVEQIADPVLPDVGVSTAKVDEDSDTASGERKPRAKKVEAVVVVSHISPTAPSVSDEMVGLDEEITVLRAQLAAKLRLQNAQLKKMLERFER
jgi:hypothetical protein